MQVRDLSEAELAELDADQTSGLNLPDDGEVVEMSGAELALLEQEEGFSIAGDGDEFSEAAYADPDKALRSIFNVARNNTRFQVKVIDEAASADMVNLYDTRTGQKNAVSRTLLSFYLTKTHPNGQRVFSARPVPLTIKRTIPCAARVCHEDGGRTMFATVESMEKHWRFKHQDDWQRVERERERANDERSLAVLEGLQKTVTLLASGSSNLSPEDVRAITEAASVQQMDLLPNATWSRRKVVGWGEAHGFPQTPERAAMSIPELLVEYGLEDAPAAAIEDAVAV